MTALSAPRRGGGSRNKERCFKACSKYLWSSGIIEDGCKSVAPSTNHGHALSSLSRTAVGCRHLQPKRRKAPEFAEEPEMSTVPRTCWVGALLTRRYTFFEALELVARGPNPPSRVITTLEPLSLCFFNYLLRPPAPLSALFRS